ncbi:hypothetical protein [Streptomyces sp. NPDC048636]|uniref:hypothetical protein n=1 Tax=Streptomyces sp. NPDC048636 TaxID=3155762 RepID=UPI00343086DC
MSAFIQQLPALLGVLVGALGSYLAITKGDEARFRREQRARWEERRLAVYADYATALKRSVTLAYRIASHLGVDPHPHPLSPEEAAAGLAEATDARDPAGEALLMLGTPEVVERARAWVVAVVEIEQFLREPVRTAEGWSALLARQRAAREEYYAAVRRDVALPPGHSGHWTLHWRPSSGRSD